jgi:hypothetical protein
MEILLTEALKQFSSQVVEAQKVIRDYSTVKTKILQFRPVTASDAIYCDADYSTGYVKMVYFRDDVSIGISVTRNATEFL